MARNKNNGFGFVPAFLAVCVCASSIVLTERLNAYANSEAIDIIPLTISNGTNSAQALSGSELKASIANSLVPVNEPRMVVYDNDTVWQTETDVEIFKLAYDNDNGETTVESRGLKDKLIAPGTSNKYFFTLQNTGNVKLDYEMTMKATVSGLENAEYSGGKITEMPIDVRVWDYNNKYLIGDKDSTVNVMHLNEVSENAALSPGKYATYTLEWEWPFEQGLDERDTALGNLAVDEDLVLTVKIMTLAKADDGGSGGFDDTTETTTKGSDTGNGGNSGGNNDTNGDNNSGGGKGGSSTDDSGRTHGHSSVLNSPDNNRSSDSTENNGGDITDIEEPEDNNGTDENNNTEPDVTENDKTDENNETDNNEGYDSADKNIEDGGNIARTENNGTSSDGIVIGQDAPNTGDHNNIGIFVGIMIGSLVLFILATVLERRKKDENE